MDNYQIEEIFNIIEPQRDLSFNVGEFVVDANELLTDDLVYIFIHFKNNKKYIKDLVRYVEQLPYSLKIDMMFYFSQHKKEYNELMKIKSFNNMIDDFAASIADIKLQ